MQAQTERAAQTNRIAEAVQRGQLDTLTLWAAVRGYAAKKALRWVAALHHRCGVELDDLMQEAYLAMLRAVRLWRPDGGTGFIGIYELTLRTAFADACGIRTVRSRSDPLQTAVSLDAPVGEDGDEAGTLGSLVSDESAERPFLGIEQQELADAVQESLQSLPEGSHDRRFLVRQAGRRKASHSRPESAQNAHGLPNAANVCLSAFSFWTRLRAHARARKLRADTVQNLKKP